MKFTDKLNKIEGKTYTVEEEIIVTNGKYEGFLGHDNVNINTLAIYTEKGLKGDKITNYSISKKEDAEWKTFIELYHPTNVFAIYETSGDIVEAEDINILQDSILELNEKIKNVSLGADITKEIQDLKNKDIELENSINSKIAELVDSSPSTLDTLKELANALNNDPNFATTITTELSLKANKNYVDSELSKKSNVHTHPYKDINYIPRWDEVSNKPLEFNPSSHIHSYSELENKPFIPTVDVTKSYVDAELKKKSDVHTHPYKSIDYVPSWSEITNKPNIPTVDITKEYVDEKLALKSDVHTHPYKSDTYVPSWNEITNKPSNATQSNSGFMSDIDKIKLDGIQNNANNYTHPSTHKADMVVFEDGETFQSKLSKGTLTGPKGEQGMQGPKGDVGEVGPQGPKGDTGSVGPKGDMGDSGATFTPKVDSSGNLSWTNNKGLTNPTTVNIKGPQGIQGPKGDTGLTGATGPKGDTGLQGPSGANGKDGLTTSVTVNGTKYTHSSGNITLPNYPTKISQLQNDTGLGGLPSSFTWAMLRGY